MLSDRRRVAVALAGFCVFLNLYAPQSVLPLLAGEFAVGAGQASLAITASTLAVALMAPFVIELGEIGFAWVTELFGSCSVSSVRDDFSSISADSATRADFSLFATFLFSSCGMA